MMPRALPNGSMTAAVTKPASPRFVIGSYSRSKRKSNLHGDEVDGVKVPFNSREVDPAPILRMQGRFPDSKLLNTTRRKNHDPAPKPEDEVADF
jgi:hypothetical protein